MNKRFKGFTIAELLIALLIISIVLAAAIPTITKRKVGSESIWQWSETQNSTYFTNITPQASAIIGNTFRPGGDVIMKNVDQESGGFNTNGIVTKFVNDQDKLILVKGTPGVNGIKIGDDTGSAHISFYNLHGATMAYSGRLTMDATNLGLGMGVLEKLTPTTCSGTAGSQACSPIGNIAIGQYSSIANQTGSFNTAIGVKSLSQNQISSYNSMFGYKAGAKTNSTDANQATMNTGIGSFAMVDNTTGFANTAIGYSALAGSTEGKLNTALGTYACTRVAGTGAIAIGSGNLCLGYNAGNKIFSKTPTATELPNAAVRASITTYRDRYNIKNETNKQDYLLFIGSDITPLIGGRMISFNNTLQRNVNINANDFDVNTPLIRNVFNIKTAESTTSTPETYGVFSFVPYRKLTSAGANDKVSTLKIYGDVNPPIYIDNYDKDNKLQLISFNKGIFNVSADNTVTTPTGKLTVGADTAHNIHVFTNNTGAAGTPYRDLYFNGGRVFMASSGDTILRNGTTTQLPGQSFISIKADDNVELRAHNGKNLIVTAKNLGLDTDSATFDVTETHNKANVFKETVNMDKTLKVEGDANFTKLGKVKYVNGGSLVDGATVTDLKAYVNAIWNAIDQVNQRASAAMTSDARLKNIQGENTAGLKEINALKVKNFTFKNDKEKIPHVGVIAQELQKVFPNSVFKGEDGYFTIRTEEIFYAMVNSIKELCTQIKDLTAKVTGLDNRIKKLEQENAQLKKQNAEFEQRLKKLEAKVK